MSSATEAVADAFPTLSEAAPAKVNLALHVTGRRPDGYHLLDTLVAFTGFGDRVLVESDGSDRFLVRGPFAAAVPSGSDNLVTRARDLVRRIATRPCPSVRITLEKDIPAASGLGGGSSDAAATLRALDRHWQLGLGEQRLHDAALALGADLPMCLAARPLRASGIGEILEPVSKLPALDMVLVNPGIEVATPAVFAALERRDGGPLPALPASPASAALLDWLATTRNDLEAPAMSIAPAIGAVLAALRESGAQFARMSGSGATCFGLFPDAESAARATAAIAREQPGWFAVATRTRASP
ncbi:MAG: 4-(cytidine 5'-diphospho)-2-C-methyl-D-erythritol kinase [Mesorhizobium sp.]|nr:4-(cytidine 5'-diphospho)-2-C-methyl-D-erythritol kinase [Mesorhizobium sp.]